MRKLPLAEGRRVLNQRVLSRASRQRVRSLGNRNTDAVSNAPPRPDRTVPEIDAGVSVRATTTVEMSDVTSKARSVTSRPSTVTDCSGHAGGELTVSRYRPG